jgi:hypothetical protein
MLKIGQRHDSSKNIKVRERPSFSLFSAMVRARVFTAAFVFGSIAACHGGGNQSAPPPGPAEHSLAGIAAQHVAVLPTYAVRVMPGLTWSIGRQADVQRALDAEIVSAMAERGLRKQWLFPEDLLASYRRNSTYASDPFALAEEPLRGPTLNSDTRLPEPLASQIRTLVALHQDVRLVLAPVELRFEKAVADVTPGAPTTIGRGVLRVVLLDSRLSNVFWSGEISSDTASVYGPAIAATIAAKLASAVAPQ